MKRGRAKALPDGAAATNLAQLQALYRRPQSTVTCPTCNGRGCVTSEGAPKTDTRGGGGGYVCGQCGGTGRIKA